MVNDWTGSFAASQATVADATQHELSRRFSAAYPLYVSAASNLLYLTRSATSSSDRTKAQKLASRCLDRAAKLKNVDPSLIARRGCLATTALEEEIILDNSERPGWSDISRPPLSATQTQAGATYVRRPWQPDGGVPLAAEDIQQAMVTDCSVVAGLAACVAHQKRFGSKLGKAAVFPQDANGEPTPSSSGQYEVRLFLNGRKRTVVVDDTLPATPGGELLCVSTAENGSLWPSLIEKAYLKVRGGYDFAGSNSCVDLYAITGWIPELIRLQSAGFRSEATWNRLHPTFTTGKCIITSGTSSQIFDGDPFVSKHAYTITDIREEEGGRFLTLLNTWRRSNWTQDLSDALPDSEGSHSTLMHDVTWEDFCARFGTISVNWDPGIYEHARTVHGTLLQGETAEVQLAYTTPASSDKAIGLHLSRHVLAKDDGEEYVCLDLRSSSQRLSSIEFTNSSDVFLQYTPPAPNSVIVLRRKGQATEISFSLTVYSDAPLRISDVSNRRPYKQKITDAWRGRSAGGNATMASFMDNPHFTIRFNEFTDAQVKLYGPKAFPMSIHVLHGHGHRFEELLERDILATSGAYTHGECSVDLKIQPGTFTIICSTFSARQEASFELAVASSCPVASITALPAEGAGMFTKSLIGRWDEYTVGDRHIHFISAGPSTCLLRLQAVSDRPALAIRLLSADGRLVAQTPVSYLASGAKLNVDKLPASPKGYVVEAIADAGHNGDYRLFVYADKPFSLDEQ